MKVESKTFFYLNRLKKLRWILLRRFVDWCAWSRRSGSYHWYKPPETPWLRGSNFGSVILSWIKHSRNILFFYPIIICKHHKSLIFHQDNLSFKKTTYSHVFPPLYKTFKKNSEALIVFTICYNMVVFQKQVSSWL